MVVDLENAAEAPSLRSSVCIAGGGAAGIGLAVELARLGVSVTLLESGGLEHEARTQTLYESDVAGHRHNGIHTGRFRVLGGTTTKWGGQILELDSQDFEHRPWVPGSGWPFPKSTLTGYYRQALELEGLSTALLEDAAVWNAIRVPAPDFGEALTPFFSRWCPEPDFARIFKTSLLANPLLTVCLHANVTRILLNESRNAIAGLVCRTLAGRALTVTADTYVFCLGGIETARLLLQPLADGTGAPWNAAGLTGRFFQDHIDSTLIEVRPRRRGQLHRWFDNIYHRGFKYHPKLKLAPKEQRRLRCLAIGATFEFRTKKGESQSEFREGAKKLMRGKLRADEAVRLARRLPDSGLLLRQAFRFKCQGRAYNPDDAGIFMRVHCEQAPQGGSRITLAADRDELGMLRSSLDWQIADAEIETMRHFTEVVRAAFGSSGFADVQPCRELEDGGPGLLSRFDDSNHHMGATRMASSPQHGVVDPDLRLFGAGNGYVCSSSVFPSSGFSNPTHTLMALALRLAGHLAAQVGRNTFSAQLAVSSQNE